MSSEQKAYAKYNYNVGYKRREIFFIHCFACYSEFTHCFVASDMF
jgi:hypothetical protein